MNRQIKQLIRSLCAFGIATSPIFAFSVEEAPVVQESTYFDYSQQELRSVEGFKSYLMIQVDEIEKWDRQVYNLYQQFKQSEQSLRIFAYLTVAQRDFAFLSRDITGHFAGSLDAVSAGVLSLFFPSYRSQNLTIDSYSQKLASIVLAKIQKRFRAEEQGIHPVDIKEGSQYWAGEQPYFGITIPSWKPWFLHSKSQFKAPAPPPYNDPEWKKQLALVREACTNLNENQKQKIMYWAGKGEGDRFKQGDWLQIATDYMVQKGVPLASLLEIRAVLSTALEDSFIEVFESKYTYWVKRPAMLDPTLHTTLPAPDHPSYPSGHSTVSGTANVILNYFFPQDRDLWNQLAQQAGLSRIWCGIHFPIDHQKGLELGKQVGEYVIQSLKKEE